jgi:4-hydroxy-tetrahydrodipicolinate synthase
MSIMDLRGLNPAPITAFTREGELDHKANADIARWLVSVKGVNSLVILGHAGEGTFLTAEEQVSLIRT